MSETKDVKVGYGILVCGSGVDGNVSIFAFGQGVMVQRADVDAFLEAVARVSGRFIKSVKAAESVPSAEGS